ncbi:HesB/YadR/YfhF family protein [Halalkalibacter urbisdiaboli]|uniref:HesB/YadR/YfhF family protein n=1 Tax=Halalkalibacter urbisdiaboli TaxID=1960589 RepID=UPI000B433EBB|nr:HesB/YadR/YfhF family protein [Halalkalibacter urbisdiaboli]
MKIEITKPALAWFKQEFDLQGKGEETIRFYARLGGCASIQTGFSLGISQDTPSTIGVSQEMEGILFFIEQEDLWFFKQYDLKVKFSRKRNEIEFVYEESA